MFAAVCCFLWFALLVGDSRGLPVGSTLHAVVVLYRHGDRSPLSSWPSDPYFANSSLWPDGYGQLNNKGKRRHYELGQWFRARYADFLPARYNQSDIYVRSTDVDRTLMSAASNLAGLYPPVTEDQNWNRDLDWQPIPIHTLPKEEDLILKCKAVSCPKYDILFDELTTGEELGRIYKENEELFLNLSKVTGLDEVDLEAVSGLFSTLVIYKGENLSLPEWTDLYWPQIKSLAGLHFKLPTYTPQLARLLTGPFFDYLLGHFYSVQAQVLTGFDDVNHPKFLMLSSHDSTVAPVADAMGVYNDAVPEFASTLLWELRSGNEGEFFLNVYFKNSTHFEQVRVRDCQIDCSLDDFKLAMEFATVDEDTWRLECQDL